MLWQELSSALHSRTLMFGFSLHTPWLHQHIFSHRAHWCTAPEPPNRPHPKPPWFHYPYQKGLSSLCRTHHHAKLHSSEQQRLTMLWSDCPLHVTQLILAACGNWGPSSNVICTEPCKEKTLLAPSSQGHPDSSKDDEWCRVPETLQPVFINTDSTQNYRTL